jgi:predicted nuclease of predicted toxin-antitoxin system
MKFVIDAQLPPALADWLRAKGAEAWPVRELGLRDADDGAIWDWAVRSEAVIVTKDRDFAARRAAAGSGPQIVWLRIGNTLNRALSDRLSAAWPTISALLSEGEAVVEIR